MQLHSDCSVYSTRWKPLVKYKSKGKDGKLMKKKVLFKDGNELMLVSFNVNNNEGNEPKSVTISVAIDENDSATTVDDVLDSIESGIQSITYENGEVDNLPIVHEGKEYDFTFVSPDYHVHNSERFYMGTDVEGGAVYARAVIGVTVLTEAEGETYISDLRASKIAEMSAICHEQIEKGLEVTLSDGTTRQFSYGQVDRENISEMFNAVVFGATAYPYHEDDGNCQTFSAADIVTIYSAMATNKTHHTTYFNQLKQMLKAKTSARLIANVTYGQDLTGKYLESYNSNMAEAAKQLQNILAKMQG